MPSIDSVTTIPSVSEMSAGCSENMKKLALQFEEHGPKALSDAIVTLIVTVPEENLEETYDYICSNNPSVPRSMLVAFCTIARRYFTIGNPECPLVG